jgi:trk system potassium uptake protein TrkH
VSAPFPYEGESFQPVPEPKQYEFSQALRVASFQVASCATDTGYVTDDFDVWPNYARMALVVVMCLGGCAGSTAGGIKMIRVLMFIKLGYIRIYNTFRPKTIRPLRIDGETVDEQTQHRAFTFLALYLGWFAFGCLFMSLMGLPFDSAFSSMTACINNCGPGLEHVGAVRDYHLIHPVGIAFLSATMLVGRLELVPMLVLLAPGFWRR